MNIADKIKSERKSAGLTQQEVSDKLNISRKTLSSWENNRSNPDLKMLKSLAEFFDKDLSYFLKDKEDKHVSKLLILLYWINVILFVANIIVLLFTETAIKGIPTIELCVVILLFTIGNQEENKLKIKFKWLIFSILFIVFFILSMNYILVCVNCLSLGGVIGSLLRSIILTWSFYCILKFSKNI